MKNKLLIITAITLTFVSFVALPLDAEAKTVTEFQAEIEKYTKELEQRKAKIATSEEEIKQIKAKIASTEASIKTAEEEIERLQTEIDECEKEIEKKSEESKNIISYYQISNGENAYLEYAFGANDITDMIYRISIVEQLTEYNEIVIKELDALIKKNQQQQQELEAKKVELNDLKKQLEKEQSRIALDISQIKAGMPSIEEQLKSAKSQLSYAKSLGCGANEDLNSCIYRVNQSNRSSGGSSASVPSTNGFYRPMEYGYITQYYSGCIKYLSYKGVCEGHIGMDLSSSNKSIPIYPIADGVVTDVYHDPAGAKVVRVKHNYNGKYIYSTYAHLRSFSVSENQLVTHNTQLGLMGSTGNSTGPHLHIEVTTCNWRKKDGGCSWRSYAESSTINPQRYVSIPSRWSNR